LGRGWVIAKKIFSVGLVFNALLTITFAVNVLANFYAWKNWQPFAPYLISGNFFWLAVAAGVLNIFPCAKLGRSLHTGRFLFHHYLYGIIVFLCAVAYVVLFVPVTLLNLFFVFDNSFAVSFGRFFILGGLALLLDDLPDVSARVESSLNRLKLGVGRFPKLMSTAQILCGAASIYVAVAIAVAMYFDPTWALANSICVATFLISGISCLIFVKRSFWQNIN
jgi:hypothetical protein